MLTMGLPARDGRKDRIAIKWMSCCVTADAQ